MSLFRSTDPHLDQAHKRESVMESTARLTVQLGALMGASAVAGPALPYLAMLANTVANGGEELKNVHSQRLTQDNAPENSSDGNSTAHRGLGNR